MSFPDDPRDLKVGFAFGHTDAEDPTGLSFDQVAPEAGDDPGPVLGTIRITRGRVGDSSTTDPTGIDMALRDTDGDFSPRNVTGAHYGELRNGTPLQVAVDVGAGDEVVGTAFVPNWNPIWSGPDIDDQVPISALGILSKLGRDQKQKSALFRTITGQNNSLPFAYWPMEEGTSATQIASGLPGGNPIPAAVLGPIVFTTTDIPPGSAGAFDLIAEAFVLTDPYDIPLPSATELQVEFVGVSDQGADTAMVTITIDLDNIAGPQGVSTGLLAAFADGEPHHRAVSFVQDGGDIDVILYVDGVQTDTLTLSSATFDPEVRIFFWRGVFDAGVVNISHFALFENAGAPPAERVAAMVGHAGEQAHERAERICLEENIPYASGVGDYSAEIGPQPVGTSLAVLRDSEATDHGVLYELRDGRIQYATNASRYNAPVALALTYGTEAEPGDVSDLLQYDDDRDLYNRITVTRRGGSSATTERDEGPLSVDETTGVGPRPLAVTLNLAGDNQVADHAGWLLHAGTINKPRYVVVLDLYANPDLADGYLDLDIGSRITISGAPAKHVGPDDLDLIVEGERVVAGPDRWLVNLWCEPYDLWGTGEYQDTSASGDVPRYDTDQSTTSGDFDSGTDTSLTVVTAAGPVWTTNPPGGFPILIRVAGVVLSVTNITGSSSPQTFTISTTVVNGVEKTIPSGSQVRVARPAYYAL